MPHKNRTHGMSKSATYSVWMHMKARCSRPSCSDYPKWGGRGIKICERWMVFSNFLSDMGEVPAGMSIDRVDNDGDYEPSNCRWATKTIQNRNTRANNRITHNGKTMCITEWAEEVGISHSTILTRLYAGWSVKDALEQPSKSGHVNKLIEFNGERKSLKAWAESLGISLTGLHSRISRGWPLDRALSK